MYDSTILQDLRETLFCFGKEPQKNSDDNIVRIYVDQNTGAQRVDMLASKYSNDDYAFFGQARLKQPLAFIDNDMCVDLLALERAARRHSNKTSSNQVNIAKERCSNDSLKSFLHITNDSNFFEDQVVLPSQEDWLTKFVSQTTMWENSWKTLNPDLYTTVVFDEMTMKHIRSANIINARIKRCVFSLSSDQSKVSLVTEAKWGDGRYLVQSSRTRHGQWKITVPSQGFRDICKIRGLSEVEIYSGFSIEPVASKTKSYRVYRKRPRTFMRFIIESLVAKYEFWLHSSVSN